MHKGRRESIIITIDHDFRLNTLRSDPVPTPGPRIVNGHYHHYNNCSEPAAITIEAGSGW